jgi:hypothetical protein
LAHVHKAESAALEVRFAIATLEGLVPGEVWEPFEAAAA